MPNDQKNIERQRATLQKLKDLLARYTKIYEEDGVIDSEEQKSIDEMNEKITRAEEHLAQLENGEVSDERTEDGFSNDLDSDTLAKKRAARAKNMDKMGKGVEKIENAVGKASPEKIEKAIEKYEAALETIIEQANEDGVVDEEEQQKINAMEQKLAKLRDMLDESSDSSTSTTETTVEDNTSSDEDTSEEEQSTTDIESSEEERLEEDHSSDEETEELIEEGDEETEDLPEDHTDTESSDDQTPPDRERIEGYKSRLRDILAQLGLE